MTFGKSLRHLDAFLLSQCFICLNKVAVELPLKWNRNVRSWTVWKISIRSFNQHSQMFDWDVLFFTSKLCLDAFYSIVSDSRLFALLFVCEENGLDSISTIFREKFVMNIILLFNEKKNQREIVTFPRRKRRKWKNCSWNRSEKVILYRELIRGISIFLSNFPRVNLNCEKKRNRGNIASTSNVIKITTSCNRQTNRCVDNRCEVNWHSSSTVENSIYVYHRRRGCGIERFGRICLTAWEL